MQNNRVKSERKLGREKGHKRSAPTVCKNQDQTIKVSKVETCTCGCKTIELAEVSRDLISIEVIAHTKQYVGKKTKCPCCNKEYLPKFPSNVNSIIYYDESIKALVVYLNSYCNMPNQKVTELFDLLSAGKIKMYQGSVCHDHNTIHLSFPQSKQAECNFHILRYCKAEYEEAKEQYLKLLDKWDEEFNKEYTKERAQYYDTERCLKSRLREYVDDHLRFLTDFRIDFTNNLTERDLRKIKTKLKIAGGFRNLKFSKYYCSAISIIDTCKKQNMNIYETLKNIFMSQKKIFAF